MKPINKVWDTITAWGEDDKYNPVISAGMPKSSDHGWQTS